MPNLTGTFIIDGHPVLTDAEIQLVYTPSHTIPPGQGRWHGFFRVPMTDTNGEDAFDVINAPDNVLVHLNDGRHVMVAVEFADLPRRGAWVRFECNAPYTP